MSLVDKYLHPGDAPEKPTSSGHLKQRFAYNDWVNKIRRHTP